jgi:serine/threonine protein kinase
MSPPSWGGIGGYAKPLEVLWADGERLFCRTWRGDPRQPVLAVLPAAEHPTPETLDRLANEYGLKDHLDSTWAARPVELIREHGRTMLLLECPGGEPLDHLIGPPMEMGKFLRLAVALSATLCRLHERGLMHKDIKPANVLVDVDTSRTWLTGFGIATRSPREQQSPEPPEVIPGTLSYMAPEQHRRRNSPHW